MLYSATVSTPDAPSRNVSFREAVRNPIEALRHAVYTIDIFLVEGT